MNKTYSRYIVGKNGSIYSKIYNKFLKPRKNTRGYYQVCLTSDQGTRDWLLVSRLVAWTYLGLDLTDEEKEVDHIDNDPTNNEVKNLQVLTKTKHLDKTLSDRGGFRHTRKCSNCFEVFTSIYSHLDTCKNCRIKVKSVLTEQDIVEAYNRSGSWVGAGKMLGYSDNGLRKYYKRVSGKDPKLIKNEPV